MSEEQKRVTVWDNTEGEHHKKVWEGENLDDWEGYHDFMKTCKNPSITLLARNKTLTKKKINSI